MTTTKKKRTRTFPCTECLLYEILHTDPCLIIRGKLDVRTVPLVHPTAGWWPVGTKFLQLASKRKSAGFPHLEFEPGLHAPLEYLGQYADLDGVLALFRAGDNPGPGAYFGYHFYPEDGTLIWGTAGYAGRVIDLTDCLPLPTPHPAP